MFNFQTVHERNCELRDKGDMSGFENVEKSKLWHRVHDECREEFSCSGFWWVPDEVELDANGTCHVVVRYCPCDARLDDSKHMRSTIRFSYCKPQQVAARLEEEKKLLL